MKRMIGRFVLSPEFQGSIWAPMLRNLIRSTSSLYTYSSRFLTDMQVTPRPHYAYCMLHAADLAKRLGHRRISALEFGVAGGNGLAYLCDFSRNIEREMGVTIDCYGFDTGQGMPEPEGAKDLPFWFQASQYRMDQKKLRERLPTAKLVIGNIKDTVGSFVESQNPAPIAVIVNDTDYWSSTRDSFRLFDSVASRPENFMPRIFMYFDDIIGTPLEMYGSFNGQLAAINEFNANHPSIKFQLNQNLLSQSHLNWRFQIYYAHLFEHPLYGRYIGGVQQEAIQRALELQS